ncbi:phospholipase A(1) DAD1, chloroplastic-like [Coffea eugenioides]|uniref:Phospholipase A(1) DAD1, chloroplastic-like n=1 Tax=Coffea arabica TaxID=13443 RepID=A0A6P6W1W7_COFAR|nr:phospholipase A(1) DAD1, chloroplastic-like [Coffea arabica]XP_027157719.1 phospholipase A(1) DAD1, chloroplastic-like [Coffea eugenioides]
MRLPIGMVRPCTVWQGSISNLPVTEQLCAASASHSSLSQSTKLKITNSLSTSIQCFEGIRAARLRDKWLECQGIKNWEGLLDPLDDDLRSEILRYGQFVDAAYRCFDFDASSPTYAQCGHAKESMLAECGLGTSGYQVTESLHATCSVQVPRWIERLPNWVSTQSSWIGYVAVCDDKEEISRLGRRDVVISYRGTATCHEWLENLRATLTCLPDDMAPENCDPMVQSGFLSLYTSSTDDRPSLQQMVREEIGRILQKYCDEPLSITITGHSLGAALATLTAYDITNTFSHAPIVTVVSFGGPRVGDRTFRKHLERNGTKVLRIVNSDDVITKVPGFVIDENDVAKKGAVQVAAGLPAWLQRRVEGTQWVYAEIGKELRLSSRDCPQLSKGDVATCHDLKTYLHLVNNFVSSTCPFRATAKRVLKRTNQARETALV